MSVSDSQILDYLLQDRVEANLCPVTGWPERDKPLVNVKDEPWAWWCADCAKQGGGHVHAIEVCWRIYYSEIINKRAEREVRQ